jgi:hypothetical protein
MKVYNNIFLVAFLFSLLGCSMNTIQIKHRPLPPALPGGTAYGEDSVYYFVSETEDTVVIDAVTGATGVNLKVLAGGSYGGVTDNYDETGIEGISDIDAITGATKMS